MTVPDASLQDKVRWPKVLGPSRINTWHAWPDDVREEIRRRNRNGLVFERSRWVFKCYDCGDFWYPARNGDVRPWGWGGPVIYDPCAIKRAREGRWTK